MQDRGSGAGHSLRKLRSRGRLVSIPVFGRLLCAHLEKYEASLAFPDGPSGDGGLPFIALCLPPSLKPEVHRFIEGKIRDHFDSHEQA
jgi:hypothetical protein